jgi:uncharacterized protein (TIGR02270 family)
VRAGGRPIVEDVVLQHAEQASFLWQLRSHAVTSAAYTLQDLARLDDRLDAHLDGLRIAGKEAWRLLLEQLEAGEPGEFFAAGVLALEWQDTNRFLALAERAQPNAPSCRGLVSALSWVGAPVTGAALGALWAGTAADRRIAVAALANVGRCDVAALGEALDADWGPLRARALRSIGECKHRELGTALRQGLSDRDQDCRYHAARSALLLGDTAGVASLEQMALGGGPHAEPSAELVARALPVDQALRWHATVGAASPRTALKVAGAIGSPRLVEGILSAMRVPALARPAAEAFALITGVTLDDAGLEGEAPAGFAAGPNDDPEDDDVAMDPDGDLPWPAPDAVAGWWRRQEKAFAAGQRYLLGKPMSPPAAAAGLRSGAQPQRAVASLELAMNQPHAPMFNTRARAAAQLTLLRQSS